MMSQRKRSCTMIPGVLLTAILLAGALTGCSSTREIDRTERKPHTAMRGPAYKRLIITFNEANQLAYRADRYAKAMRDAGTVDADTQLRANELAADLVDFADDIEWALANTQRMAWHQNEMNRYWDEFESLYPDDAGFVDAYTTKDMRKVTRKLDLKNQEEYRDLHEYEHHDHNWEMLFDRPALKVYKK